MTTTATHQTARKGSVSTHAALIEQARAWLWKQGCSLVITEMSHGGTETPDAIGWKGRHSILVECKASRADFLADAKKCFRREPERGMGFYRFFCAPSGLIDIRELPERWGLLEVHARGIRKAKESEHFLAGSGPREEISVLISAIRRIGRTAPEGVNVKFYTQEFYAGQEEPKCRATMGISTGEEE